MIDKTAFYFQKSFAVQIAFEFRHRLK